MRTFKLKTGLILTHDQEEEIEVNKIHITVKPVWKWLLERLCRKVGLPAFSRALWWITGELTRGLAPSENVSSHKKQRRREAGNPEALAKFSTEPLEK